MTHCADKFWRARGCSGTGETTVNLSGEKAVGEEALGGKTPAEVAGVDFKLGENRWLELVKKAMENGKG